MWGLAQPFPASRVLGRLRGQPAPPSVAASLPGGRRQLVSSGQSVSWPYLPSQEQIELPEVPTEPLPEKMPGTASSLLPHTALEGFTGSALTHTQL